MSNRLARIESYGVEHIPQDQRKSRPANLFYILFGGSISFSVVVIGWLPATLGLGWWGTFSAVLVGTAAGATLLAPMGLMGPRAGTTNPVASGAHFGVVGRIIGSLLEAASSLAFAALSIWTGGDALVGALDRLFGIGELPATRIVAYGVLSVIVTIVSIYGHDMMVAAQRFMIPTGGLVLAVGIFVYAPGFDAGFAGTGDLALGSYWPTWVLAALFPFGTIVGYTPFVGDWTRHISRCFSDKRIFATVWVGAFLGMGGPILWGTFTAVALLSSTTAAGGGYVPQLIAAAPAWYIIPLVYIGLGAGTSQAVVDTYGTGLDVSSIIPKLKRVSATTIACIISALLVYAGYFWNSLTQGISVWLQIFPVFAVPWAVIIICGFIQRRGYYNIEDVQVFNRGQRGGIYWFTHGINWRALGVLITASAIGLCFANNDLYVGPGAALVGGTDVGSLVAGVVAVLAYPVVLRIFPDPPRVFQRCDTSRDDEESFDLSEA